MARGVAVSCRESARPGGILPGGVARVRWPLAPVARVAVAEGIGPARWHLARLRPQKPRILPGGGPGCGIYQSNSKSPGKAAIWPNPGQSLTRRRAAGASCPRLRPQKPRICTNRHKGGGIYQSNSKSPGKAAIWPNPGQSLTNRRAGRVAFPRRRPLLRRQGGRPVANYKHLLC